MDDKVSDLNSGDSLPETDKTYRVVLASQRDKKDKFTPSISCFSLTPADKAEGYKLSVDWSKKTTAELSLSRVGCTYKSKTTVFKEYSNRELYALDVKFLKEIGVENVIYDPLILHPTKVGTPNNIAHSLICFKEEDYDKNEAEILLKIRNHAKEQKVPVNMNEVDRLVSECRK